jgi:hypothetical protein
MALSRLTSLPADLDIPKGFTPRSDHCHAPSGRDMTEAIALPFLSPCQQPSLRSSHASGTAPPETASLIVCTTCFPRSAELGTAFFNQDLAGVAPVRKDHI